MGFRSTFVTQHYGYKFPDWFVEKWGPSVHFGKDNGLPISSRYESKIYLSWQSLCEDIQKVMREEWKELKDIVLVWLHECGGITRVRITQGLIVMSEPVSWKVVEHVTHNYCYGCSDV